MFNKPDGAGKGDAPRPVDWDKFSENFDAIFGKKKKDEKATETNETKESGRNAD
jgi:hypothetical protein